MKKSYTSPQLTRFGTIQALTRGVGQTDMADGFPFNPATMTVS